MLESKKPAASRPSRLGRGLSSLMAAPVAVEPPAAPESDAPATAPPSPAPDADGGAGATPSDGLRYIGVGEIVPNRHQPRQHFDEIALCTLAESIKADGLMQPVVVRTRTGGGYELVAGERRWRASKLADLQVIPALVRDLDDRQSAELSLIENLQREDLNALERAEAFQRLATSFSLSHDSIADRVGLDRSTVANLIRLLALAPGVQQLVRDDLLSMGQARALASMADPAQQESLAKQAVREGMSVREVESAVRRLTAAAAPKPDTHAPPEERSTHFRDLEQTIGQQLGTRVAIAPGRKKGSGKMTIEFFSLEQFDALIEKLGVRVDD